MRTGSRQKVLGAFGVVGVGLMVSSTAYACTTYKGKLTASGNGTGNVAQTVVGTNRGMNWCALPTPTVAVAQGAQSISLVTAASKRTKTCAASQMRAGAYTVAATLPGAGYMPQGGGLAEHNCHSGLGQDVAVGTVDASGVFTSSNGTSTISYSQIGTGPQSICIFSDTNADAIAINMDTV